MRVVKSGFLATRNCRMVNRHGQDILPISKGNMLVTYESDMVCDYGGHIWAGKLSWLREAWSHPPFDLSNCEDIWISAVLNAFLGVKTRQPFCPRPTEENNNWHAELCACADMTALKHQAASVGGTTTNDSLRNRLIAKIAKSYNMSLTWSTSNSDFARFRALDGSGYNYHARKGQDLVFTLPASFEHNCWSWN